MILLCLLQIKWYYGKWVYNMTTTLIPTNVIKSWRLLVVIVETQHCMQILMYVLNVHYRITSSSFCAFTQFKKNRCPLRSCIVKAFFIFLC